MGEREYSSIDTWLGICGGIRHRRATLLPDALTMSMTRHDSFIRTNDGP